MRSTLRLARTEEYRTKWHSYSIVACKGFGFFASGDTGGGLWVPVLESIASRYRRDLGDG